MQLPVYYLLLSLQLEIMEVTLKPMSHENRVNQVVTPVTLGSLPGCPVLVPGHSHILAFWNGAWGLTFINLSSSYSAAIFKPYILDLFETEARVSGLLMEKGWTLLAVTSSLFNAPQNPPLGSPFPWTATTLNISQGSLYLNKWVQIQFVAHHSPPPPPILASSTRPEIQHR